MSKFFFNSGLSGVAAAALLAMTPAHAGVPTVNLVNDPNLIHVSGGCGPNGWRGQWGHCHYYGGSGWRGGWWGPRPLPRPRPGLARRLRPVPFPRPAWPLPRLLT
ncbi:MAG: hypothetical protein WDM85_04825 [Caulobacteraceae bacterium]